MLCPQCQSSNRKEFPTEMMIHKGHLGGAIPDLLTFPRAWVCLECGCSTFTLAQNELLDLKAACVNNGFPINCASARTAEANGDAEFLTGLGIAAE
jgi:hypothetical protein